MNDETLDATADRLDDKITWLGAQSPIGNVLRHFRFKHLRADLQPLSAPFARCALVVVGSSSNADTVVALRKLKEAKDWAVAAAIP